MKNSLLTRRVVEIIDSKSLEKKLSSSKKLRVKLGIDPTGSELHLGHAVTLWKLREFQEAGHKAIFLVGDWTARIGDPSGKDETRPPLSEKEIERNAKDFFAQAFLILDKKKTEIHMQSEWYDKFDLKDVIKLTSQVTVKQLLAHETFRQRINKDLPFYLHETIYPLLQGYDSVALRSDIELGAREQKFNLLMGREIQRVYGQKPQDIVMVDYLIGLDGKEKMSKTLGNYVSLRDKPGEMFGKIMSIPDERIVHYFELCTNYSDSEVQSIKQQLVSKLENPKKIKLKLAFEIVKIYHGVRQAHKAQDVFEKKFGKTVGEIQADFEIRAKAQNYTYSKFLDLLVKGGLAKSKSDARRKIIEGAVKVDGQKISEHQETVLISKNALIGLGKRFLRVK